MLLHNKEQKFVSVGDDKLLCRFSYVDGLKWESLYLGNNGSEWFAKPVNLFLLELCGKTLTSSDMTVTSVDELRDEVTEGISFSLNDTVFGITARVVFYSEQNDWRFLLQLGAQWKDEAQNIELGLPMLAAIGKNGTWRLSANPFPKPDGTTALVLHEEYPLPDCCIAPDQRNGVCLDIRSNGWEMAPWDQCRNYLLLRPQTKEALEHIRHSLVLENQPIADTIDIRFSAVTQGWPEVWRRWAARMREGMDFSAYQRKDLQWLKTCLFQYWDFGYSKEVFNYDTQKFDVDRLIDDGLEFGGFDAILHWYVYPRLGVDERSQWQFNRDITDGYAGMREFSKRAHERGVRVFLPYNPWDARPGETDATVLDELAHVVAETDIDGVFFDTMDAVPDGLRERFDEIRPGLAFCTEGTPAKRRDVEVITCALDQKIAGEAANVMPEGTAFRYLFPENNGPFTSRWLIAEGRDDAVSRAIFNGTGLLLWQDIFGARLPYSAACRARICRWKQILLENLDTYTAPMPIPLCDVLQKGLYLNRFESENGKTVIWSLYNGSTDTITGELFRIDGAFHTAEELWRGADFSIKDGVVFGEISSRENQIFRLNIM